MFLTLNRMIHKYPLVGTRLKETDSVFEKQILIVIFGTSTGAKKDRYNFIMRKFLSFVLQKSCQND
jgi:hypothetical protein